MAAIVAAMLIPPCALAVALGLRLFDIPLAAAVTFGGALNLYAGTLAWWLLFFALALVYASFTFPWHDDQ